MKLQPEQWKWISSLLATALLTGVGAWFVLGQDAVTRDELAAHGEKLDALHESVNTLQTTLGQTNLLLATHGITFENLRPVEEGP